MRCNSPSATLDLNTMIVRHGHYTRLLSRYYTTPIHNPVTGATPAKKQPPPKPSPVPRSPPPAPPQTRHEAHEGTSAINIPYNPPGGGPAGSAAGFTFTNSPVLDAILTTAIGLGAGKFTFCSIIQSNIYQSSFRRGYRICIMVQEKRSGQGMLTNHMSFTLHVIVSLHEIDRRRVCCRV